MSALEWAVQWEVGTPAPELLAAAPEAPTYIDPEFHPDAEPENAAIRAQYVEAVHTYEALIDTDLVNPQRWQSVQSVAVDEAEARRILAELRRVHATNPLARNFELVTSPPRVWTPVQ